MNASSQRIALVTGATDGIGKEVSRQLAQQGVKVILGARNLIKGHGVAAELNQQGLNVEVVLLDVTDDKGVESAAAEINKRYGRVDILVNNAGVLLDKGPLSEMAINDFLATFQTNVMGSLRVTSAFLPLLKRSEQGRVVNVSSALGALHNISDENGPYASIAFPAYAASKAALNVLTIYQARELKGTTIKVNAVCPGLTATRYVNAPGAQPVEVGAEVPVQYALLDKDGPTGGFFDRNGPAKW